MDLKALRKQKGLTQAELANILHVAQGTVSGYENGKYDPDTATLTRMATIFGVTVDELLGEKVKKTSPEEEEIWILREKIRRNPERRILFDLAGNGDIRDVRAAVAVIEALKKHREE